MNNSKLTVLVPITAYTLAYTLPLLLISILLIFAGSFLTLDRTRSFPPAEDYTTLPGTFDTKKRRIHLRFEGGIGGSAIGYAFGVHLSTLLALLIPGTTSSSPLSPKSFLAVWLLSCIPTTILGGVKKNAALLFAGVGGGISIALGLSIILHPSLLPRQILLGIFTILLTTMLLLGSFIPRLSTILLRPSLRTASSAMGSLGLVVSIALLSRPAPVMGWANAWERLWLQNGNPTEWGTGKEKGLSAAWAVFWALGIVSDWALSRWVGECPDEKWDNYLAKYTTDPPNQPGRAGTFQPPKTFWEKLFPSKPHHGDTDYFLGGPTPLEKEKDDMVFPSEKDMKHTLPPSEPMRDVDSYYALPPPKPISRKLKSVKRPTGLGHFSVDMEVDVPVGPAFLQKKKSTSAKERWKGMVGRRRKKPIKFGTIDELSDSSSDEVDGIKGGGKLSPAPAKRPWIVTNQQSSYSSSTPTLVEGNSTPGTPPIPASDTRDAGDVDIDYDKELELLQSRLGSKEVLRYSDDEDSGAIKRKNTSNVAWSPTFLQRHQPQVPEGSGGVVPPIAGAMPVPATPSLIRAVDRIAEAQKDVYGGAAAYPYPLEGVPVTSDRSGAPRWDDFWKEVRVKAQD
ncbi:hypothetical protein D9611_007480 [Ephemerocybe angulata]|uniref:DUF4203 domain-containing protein n=1 Tax=Ephemerocybe angulata TaxID=980116 RepID=A0A8H5CF75_9AGAR|nr:hypothetical protein D9611_007480 [Tulosesus angulatus]